MIVTAVGANTTCDLIIRHLLQPATMERQSSATLLSGGSFILLGLFYYIHIITMISVYLLLSSYQAVR